MITDSAILKNRLIHQKLVKTTFTKAAQVVEYMGAMQAQEYAMAKWAIGLRLKGASENKIEKEFNAGKILRTHVLRPTWHFVSPKDIRWLLELSAPRVHQANGFMCRKLGLDNKLLKKCADLFEKNLSGGKEMTRQQLHEVLSKSKIKLEGQHLVHILMYAELEGIICSGPREGKQFTYALLDERVPPQKKLKHEEALFELSTRYFTSRGPATLQDFATWSNLTVKDAKAGIASLEKKLMKETKDGKDYYFMHSLSGTAVTRSFLMPDYDEYGMSYKDRSVIFDAEKHKRSVSRGNPVFNRMIILDGRIEGTWQRHFEKGKVIVETFPFEKLVKKKQTELNKVIEEYLAFNHNSD